ncbi:hypothetical protein [Natrinema sp. DC36]|uniref:hypothetical protein n=1 Tax=Natrinema sp. DC36 TaxID=2878680 RepID=UPI001CF03647|nr:hypothetical protein [Natrinema sp. DC36]
MASQPTNNPGQQHSDGSTKHKKLYEHCAEVKRGVERRSRRIGEEAKVNYLWKKYREEYPITEADLKFVAGLGWLEIDGEIYFKDHETGERVTRTHYISEGHRWLVDWFDPNLELLERLDLVGPPYIDSEPRERIINRRFYNLTPSGRDLVDRTFSGENVGDTGENVVHRLGMHLTNWWSEEKWDWNDQMLPEMYPTIEGAELDFCMWQKGGLQFVNGEDVDKHTRHVFEVETGTSDVDGIVTDATKLAYLRGDSWWVFPTRDVLVGVLEELTMRGYTGLSRPIPETLAMRNHRDTYNQRLEDVEPEISELNHPPVEHVMTFKMMVDDLKEWRPELFYGSQDQK